MQQAGCALHRPPIVKPSPFSGGGLDVWNFDPPTLPRRSLELPSSTFTGGLPAITSLPLPMPHHPQHLPYRITTNLLPAVSDSRLASPKPWYSQVEYLSLTANCISNSYSECTDFQVRGIPEERRNTENLDVEKTQPITVDTIEKKTKKFYDNFVFRKMNPCYYTRS